MVYHALRLACITISSFKTWKAVVDSTDRSQARRHLFLWFLTLAGVALEPISDSLLSQQVPMYEGIKIIVAGWLLLAHFYISTPAEYTETHDTWKDTHHRAQNDTHLLTATPSNRDSSFQESGGAPHSLSQQRLRILRQDNSRAVTSTAANLDFGRFKRDLERRQSRSVTSLGDYGVSSHMLEEPRLRQHPRDLDRTVSASALSNPFSVQASARSPLDARSRSASEFGRPRLSISAASAPAAALLPVETKSPLGEIYRFGTEQATRKRPLSAAASEMPISRSIPRQNSRQSTTEVRRRTLDQRTQPDFEEVDEEPSTSRMAKRMRQMAEDDNERGIEEAVERVPVRPHKDSAHRSTDVAAGATERDDSRKTEQTTQANFARPKPPGKNRRKVVLRPSTPNEALNTSVRRQDSKEPRKNASTTSASNRPLLAKREDAAEPEEIPEVVSASFESRMKHVRDWLKERNPSMISPPLSTRSEMANTTTRPDQRASQFSLYNDKAVIVGDKDGHAVHGVQMPSKRKAIRQLAPKTGVKRMAREQPQDPRRGRRSEENGRSIYPEPRDTIASASQPQSQIQSQLRRSGSSQPHRPVQRSASSTSTIQLINGVDPLRDQPKSDPFLPTPLNWSRFQKPVLKTTPKTPTSSSANASTVPTSAFTFRRTLSKNSNPFITDNDEDTVGISPLIKLRQSQLKQRQQDDFLGIKYEEKSSAAAEGTLAFNAALEAWEREDDEELAQNAAKEAAEAEAKGRRYSRQPEDASPTSSSSEGYAKEAITSSSLAEKGHVEMAAPTPSLLRTIPFNGESSRRPVPDLQSKNKLPVKEIMTTPRPRRTVSDIGAGTAALGATSFSSPGLDQQRPQQHYQQQQQSRPLGVRGFSESFARGNTGVRGSLASLVKRGSAEDSATRRQRHPGLYTPSKKRPMSESVFSVDHVLQPQSPHTTTPTVMSRYIQLSNLSDEEDLYD